MGVQGNDNPGRKRTPAIQRARHPLLIREEEWNLVHLGAELGRTPRTLVQARLDFWIFVSAIAPDRWVVRYIIGDQLAIVAHVDDSGSSKVEPIYVLGGLILPTESWDLLTKDWDATLKAQPAIEYFKASEVWDRTKGPFKNFTTSQRSEKVEALADVVLTYRPRAISCRMRWSTYREFRKKVSINSLIDDPYFFLYHAIIGQIAIWGAAQNTGMRVNFIFDNQNGLGERVRAVWKFFLNSYTDELRARMGDIPEFADEKACLPLQAADLFAWYQRRSALGTLGHESHIRIWERFKNIRYSTVLKEINLARITALLENCIPKPSGLAL
jgi:hypothetical protein